MRKIYLFMMVSLDGFFEGENHDLSWHNVDDEFNEFAAKQMQDNDLILFGRRTYQLMERFWPSYKPTDTANTIVRDQMDSLPKIVFSKSLKTVQQTNDWQHVTLKNEVKTEEIQMLKQQEGKDIAVLGSSNLCITLLQKNLLDELRIMINPVVLGKGTRLFEGIDAKINFQLKKTKTFHSGNILLYYNV